MQEVNSLCTDSGPRPASCEYCIVSLHTIQLCSLRLTCIVSILCIFLPAQRYASAVIAVIVRLSVRPCVYMYVTRRYCIKTADVGR